MFFKVFNFLFFGRREVRFLDCLDGLVIEHSFCNLVLKLSSMPINKGDGIELRK